MAKWIGVFTELRANTRLKIPSSRSPGFCPAVCGKGFCLNQSPSLRNTLWRRNGIWGRVGTVLVCKRSGSSEIFLGSLGRAYWAGSVLAAAGVIRC